MKLTCIRTQTGDKPVDDQISAVENELNNAFSASGFITDVNLSFGKIGLHMRSFRINTDTLGHNARTSPWGREIAGWKKTDVPTWDQRVEFNDIINNVFDRFGWSANIKSGTFHIRSKKIGAFNESDWNDQDRGGFYGNSGPDVFPLTEDMIADAKDAHKAHRKAKREKKKQDEIDQITSVLNDVKEVKNNGGHWAPLTLVGVIK